MVKLFLLLSLFVKIEHDPVIVDRFDVVEVNHHLNRWGQERWTQVIFWNWHEGHETHHVDHFYMLRDCYKHTKSGEIAHNKMLDIVERFIPDIRERQKFRTESRYKGDFVPTKFYPKKDWINNKYVVEYIDHSGKHRIECGAMQETFTQEDPEILDRARQPQFMRSGLSNGKLRQIIHLEENLQKIIRS